MQNIYRTRDLYEGSFLYATGQKLLGLQNDHGQCWFIFEDNYSCNNLIDMYWRKEAHVDAKTLTDSFKSLKDRIFSLSRNVDKNVHEEELHEKERQGCKQ